MNVTYIQDQSIVEYKGNYYHAKSEHYLDKYLYGLNESEKLTVCCWIEHTDDQKRVNKYKCISNSRIKFVELPDFRKIKMFLLAYKILEKVVKNSHFVYIRCGVYAGMVMNICKKNRISYAAILNEDIQKSTAVHKSLKVRCTSIALGAINRRVVKNAEHAIYVTQEYLQQNYPNSNDIFACSDIEDFLLDEKKLNERLRRIKLKKDGSIIHIGTVGSVDAFLKGHDTVIYALAELKREEKLNYVYHIVGPGDCGRLQELAKQLNVIENVIFEGEKSRDDVLLWMESIDIYLHPSRSEGLPRTIIEALSVATPCICSNVGGIPELVPYKWLFSYETENTIKQLVSLLLNMTKEEQLICANENFLKAMEYAPVLLQKKQKDYYTSLIYKERKLVENRRG